MSKSESEQVQQCVNRFIDLANTIKDDGVDIKLISHALMSASSVYTTYAYAGNDGGLNQSGVEKVVERYKRELERIQDLKKKTRA